MKKAFLLVLLSLILFACTRKPKSELIASEADSLTADIATVEKAPIAWDLDIGQYHVYEKGDTIINFPETVEVSEEVALANEKGVKRTENILSFQLTNGQTIELKDNSDFEAEDYRTHIYKSSFDNINQWLVMVSYMESFEYLLIDRHDGTQQQLWGLPVFSPDETMFFTSQVDLEAGFVPNGIQLWAVEKGKPVKLWEKELFEWGVTKLLWANKNYVLAEQLFHDHATGEQTTRFIKMRLYDFWADEQQ